MKRKSPMPGPWDGQSADPEPVPTSVTVHGDVTAPIYLSGREMALLLFAARAASREYHREGMYVRSRNLEQVYDRLDSILREKFPGVKESLLLKRLTHLIVIAWNTLAWLGLFRIVDALWRHLS